MRPADAGRRRPGALRLPHQPLPQPDDKVLVPVDFTAGQRLITSVALSLDLDTTRVAFDPTDADGDGIPDAVRFFGAPSSWRTARFDPDDTRGELDVLIADLDAPPLPLVDGRLLEVELLRLQPGGSVAGTVTFGEPAASFGDADGRRVGGTSEVTGVVIFVDHFESDDTSAWSWVFGSSTR